MKDTSPCYNVYVSTHKGNIRQKNEDNFAVNTTVRSCSGKSQNLKFRMLPEPLLCAVFDGMGGEACGEEASEIAALISVQLYKYLADSGVPIENEIHSYVRSCNREITNELKSVNAGRGGSTFAMAYGSGGELKLFSLGDSRIYLYSDFVLKQISVDHTLAMKKYSANIYTREEAQNSADKHKLTDFLGNRGDNVKIKVEAYESLVLNEGDMLLMCSDGLYDMCGDDEIAYVMSRFPKTATIELMKRALKNGGADNITCLIITRAADEESIEQGE